MALRWFDGFDWLGTTGGSTDLGYFYTVVGTFGTTASSRTGAAALSYVGVPTGYLEKLIPFSGKAIVGFGYQNGATLTNAREVMALHEGTTAHLTLVVNGSKQVAVYRGTIAGTLLGTSTATIPDNTWVFLEMRASIHDSTGTVEVWMDDVLILNLTAQDTQNGGTGALDRIRLGRLTNNVAANVVLDDFYVADDSGSGVTAPLGSAVRVDCVLPTGAGSSTQFTASAGSNYQCVDETPPNEDTDYVSTSTAGHVDLYAMGDLPVTPTAIKATMVCAVARKDDVGSRTLRTKLKSGGTTSNGASNALAITYAGIADMYEVDPNTGSAWTKTAIDAMEVGIENV